MVTISAKGTGGRFHRGRGVYTCATCGRQTRETTIQGSDDCEQCFELAGLQNMVWDGCFDEADKPERDVLLSTIVQRGGNAAKVQAAFSDLFNWAPKVKVGTIDLTPTWVSLIPYFVAAIENGTDEGRRIAIDELKRLAAFADAKIAEDKK